MDLAGALVVPLWILRFVAVIGLVTGIATRVAWPARAAGLRLTAIAAAAWSVWLWASLEAMALGGGVLSPALSFAAVILGLGTAFVHGRDRGVAGIAWAALGFHALMAHWIGLGPVQDWRAFHAGDAPELTVAELAAAPDVPAAHLTDARCLPALAVRWTTKGSQKGASTIHHRAVGLVGDGWVPDDPVALWLDDAEDCSTTRRVSRVVRDRGVDSRMRAVVPGGVEVPSYAVLVHEPRGDDELVELAALAAWLHVAMALGAVLWATLGVPVVSRPAGWVARWPIGAQWLHDRVILDLGPIRAPRLRFVEPVATGVGLALGMVPFGAVLLCGVGLLGEATGAWGVNVPTFIAVYLGGVLPVVVIGAAVASARRGGGRQELVVGPREVELARVTPRGRRVIWEVPTHTIATCAPRLDGDALRGLVLECGDRTVYVAFPDTVLTELELAEVVTSAAEAARDGRGRPWEVPPTLRALRDRPGSGSTGGPA